MRSNTDIVRTLMMNRVYLLLLCKGLCAGEKSHKSSSENSKQGAAWVGEGEMGIHVNHFWVVLYPKWTWSYKKKWKHKMSHFLIFISVAFGETGLFTFLMSKDTWLHHHFSLSWSNIWDLILWLATPVGKR